jgi:hypothetical protein
MDVNPLKEVRMSALIRNMRLLLLLTIPLALGSFGMPLSAQTQPFDVADVFFELNDTDGDLGIHAEIDGDAWTSLEVKGPLHVLLSIVSNGRLRSTGLTQLAFESAEPSFEELHPNHFFRRFPEGIYEISARAQEGGSFRSRVRLSHVMAAPPIATVSDLAAADGCETLLPEVISPVLIEWDPVTRSHPRIGKDGPVRISRYQFFVEQGATKLSVDLPPTVTEFEIPRSITDAGGVFKFEIIARTSTGNNTAIESCFRMR